MIEQARAEAERVKMIGAADAAAIEAVGKSEAEGMRLKAAAYRQYGDAAVSAMVLETLPKVEIVLATEGHLQRIFNIH